MTSVPVPARISLEELNERAELLTRTDRKYIVGDDTIGRLLDDHHADLALLEIEGRWEFTYESVYFDTPGLDLYRAAATRRRRRIKVRTRIYEGSEAAVLEVKAKDGRGRTLKYRLPYDRADRERLTLDGQRFVDDHAPGLAPALVPVLTTRYRRSTLVDPVTGSRATIDRDLVCTDPAGRTVTLTSTIVETKSDHAAGKLDRWLWQQGERPVRISKYCTALAVMHPDLPSNTWHRTLERHFR